MFNWKSNIQLHNLGKRYAPSTSTVKFRSLGWSIPLTKSDELEMSRNYLPPVVLLFVDALVNA